MSTLPSCKPYPLLLPPLLDQSRPCSFPNNLSLHHQSRSKFLNLTRKPSVRDSVGIVKFGLTPSPFDFDGSDGLIQHLFGKIEGILYTVADIAVSTSSKNQNTDWLSGVTNLMETVLKVLHDGISTLHVPYAYGFAIILLTVLVKAATFPLTKKQVESAMAMKTLQPQVKAIQELYAGNGEKIQTETARLYKLAGVNPLAGCLPTLATIPVWIGLYRALSNVADEVTIAFVMIGAAKFVSLPQDSYFPILELSGMGCIATCMSLVIPDGHPPLGWSDTAAYLALPVLLVVSQYISVQIMQSSQTDDPNLKGSQVLTKFLPLMIGYFALSVPSGLSLYWLTNNILSTTQQIWLQKLGGAKNTVRQFNEESIMAEKEKLMKESITKEMEKPKSVLGANLTKAMESRREEKLGSDGLRPGDRFKLLKEQEARRKQQKEEEKKKAQEEVVNGTIITYGEQNKEVNIVINKDENNEAELVDAGDERIQSVNVMHDSSKTEASQIVSKEDIECD
ncbi:hypothetical protein MKW94_004416 [Papaver nudicaule]|uniref:Membrane insertase YidC/Oxa/ALB C-terminal domain-containing protein n=1 Tax=Papaver nudicaule TaxID=74823 RepID=A0AA41V7V3_PAPNU|nr:hypothetical protein [Papaver nudicaule]